VEIAHAGGEPLFQPGEVARVARRRDRRGDADGIESEAQGLGLEPIGQGAVGGGGGGGG